MTPPLPKDEALRAHATDTQWLYYEKFCETGSIRATAKALGKAYGSVCSAFDTMLSRAIAGGWEMPPPKLEEAGRSTLYDNQGKVKAEWKLNRRAGGNPENLPEIPDPKLITRQSTFTRGDGTVIGQWNTVKREDREREALWEAFAAGLASELPPLPPLMPPTTQLSSDICNLYPVGDHHTGMLAWAPETLGDNYDTKIAEQLLSDVVDHLMIHSPPSYRGVLAFMGDFLHTDGYAAMTPASGHLLDADSRFPRVAESGARMMRRTIRRALEKHQTVDVYVIAGNHDPVSSIWLRIALQAMFENESRVRVHGSPAKIAYFEWNKVLIGLTHGDRVKIGTLAAIMATDVPEAWGRTLYRYVFTGHIHHDKEIAQDGIGCKVEAVRVLAPADAYTSFSGYRTPRDMKAITFHREYGEIGRIIAPAPMFNISGMKAAA